MTSDATLRRWLLAGVAATALIALSLPVYLVRQRIAGDPASSEEIAATFVGREECVSCHEDAYQAWSRSDHDHAMDVATDSTVHGDFDDAVFVRNGMESRFYRRGEGYFVFTEGPDGVMTEFEVTYTFGWEPLQQYLIPFPGGRLQALSIAWDTEEEEWFHLYPDQDISADDWLHWSRPAQTWNGMCAECHSTNLVKGYDADSRTFSTTWSEIDVSCEACHGPGSRHVDWAEMPDMARPTTDNYELTVGTYDLPAPEYVELCAPCHARRSEMGDYAHDQRNLLDIQLPAVLREGLYHADGQILEEVYVYGSFVQSKMYRNDVKCGDCHDPHSLQLKADGNDLCAQCHRADVYDSYDHHFHQKEVEGQPSDGALCVKCHMVEQPFMVRDWRADHSLRVPRPDLTAEIGTPNACAQSGCHDDEPLSYSLDAYERWYGTARKPHYGQVFAAARSGDPAAAPQLIQMAADPLYASLVRATALSLLAQYPDEASTAAFDLALADEDALVRYTALTNASAATAERVVELLSPLLFDPVNVVRMEAASRLADAPPGTLLPYQQEALAQGLVEFRAAMTHSLDFPHASLNLGNLASRLGDAFEAERYFRMAVEIDDLFAPAKINLALLLNGSGRNEEAERLLREVLEQLPDNYEVAYNLGLLLAEMNRLGEAVEFLGIASEGLLARARVHYNYGLSLQVVGRIPEAEQALLRALDVEPDNADFLFALGDHYFRRGDPQRALEMADRLIAADPAYQQGPQLRAAALQALGR